VCRGHVPLAELSRLVLIEPVVHAERDLAALQYVREVQVSGSIVDRISAEDDQQIDFAGLHVGDEFFQRFGLIDRIGVDRIGVDGRADIAPCFIHEMGQGMHSWRLVIARNDQT